jgi:hypothetical protein
VLSSSVFLLKNLIMFRVVINDEIPEYSWKVCESYELIIAESIEFS